MTGPPLQETCTAVFAFSSVCRAMAMAMAMAMVMKHSIWARLHRDDLHATRTMARNGRTMAAQCTGTSKTSGSRFAHNSPACDVPDPSSRRVRAGVPYRSVQGTSVHRQSWRRERPLANPIPKMSCAAIETTASTHNHVHWILDRNATGAEHPVRHPELLAELTRAMRCTRGTNSSSHTTIEALQPSTSNAVPNRRDAAKLRTSSRKSVAARKLDTKSACGKTRGRPAPSSPGYSHCIAHVQDRRAIIHLRLI